MVPLIGNSTGIVCLTFGSTKTWSSVGTTITGQTVTVPGLRTGDIILTVVKPTEQAGLGVLNCRVSATDTLTVNFASTAAVTPTANETYVLVVFRPTNVVVDASF